MSVCLPVNFVIRAFFEKSCWVDCIGVMQYHGSVQALSRKFEFALKRA